MKRNMIKLAVGTAALLVMSTSVSAEDAKPKRHFKNNMIVVTNIKPKSVDNISEMFGEGILYGRVRMNSFNWDWTEDDTGNLDNYAFGIGGSLLYKTASYKGISAMTGFYYSDSPFEALRMPIDKISKAKSGKDTVSRYEVENSGNYSMAVLAELNLQYEYSKTKLIAGRQIFESFITRSNDTKMIPNTFEGTVLEINEIPKTRIRGAFFTAQKLRDHTTFHDVITYDDGTGRWNANDDSAAHKGLTFANFRAAGADVNHQLIVVDVKNKSINGLKVDVTYASVPNVVASITGELNYKIALPSGYSLTPGVRYMHQMDDGGGAIGGASLNGNLAGQSGNALGYSNVDSLDASLAMARLTLKKGPLKAQIAYSQVAGSGADIVAPWRGFPTGGYTRAMAQYNWYAGTKTTCAEVNYDFDKAGLVPGFSALVRYAIQDFDEAKQLAGNVADSNVLHIDLRETITPDLYAKIRIGLEDAKARELGSNAGKNMDGYNEYRFELNYLF